MNAADEMRDAIKAYFDHWAGTDGPWWEQDAVHGLLRELDPRLPGDVRIPQANRRQMIGFLEDDGWRAVMAPRVGVVNYVRHDRQDARKLYPDLACRNEGGDGFDWLAEVKIWSEYHGRKRHEWRFTNRFLGSAGKRLIGGSMYEDLSKWRDDLPDRCTLFLLGFYSQSPACDAGSSNHCKSLDQLVQECHDWLVGLCSKDGPLPSAEFHIGFKQRFRDGIRARRVVARWPRSGGQPPGIITDSPAPRRRSSGT